MVKGNNRNNDKGRPKVHELWHWPKAEVHWLPCVQETLGDSSFAGEHVHEDDDAGESAGSNEEFGAGEGVEEMLRLLEEGGSLPDIEGLMEAENPQVLFMVLLCPALFPPCPALPRPAHVRAKWLCPHAITFSHSADFAEVQMKIWCC